MRTEPISFQLNYTALHANSSHSEVTIASRKFPPSVVHAWGATLDHQLKLALEDVHNNPRIHARKVWIDLAKWGLPICECVLFTCSSLSSSVMANRVSTLSKPSTTASSSASFAIAGTLSQGHRKNCTSILQSLLSIVFTEKMSSIEFFNLCKMD